MPHVYESLGPAALALLLAGYLAVWLSDRHQHQVASRGGGEITLGRGSIIDGSDVVTVNGERWKRDTDYTIDYDLGRISLKRQLGPADQLNIDYSYAPLFQQAGRTLIGSASYRF